MATAGLRVLLIAEAANPEWVSVPLIGWSLARAIADRTTRSHLVTQIRNRESLLRAGLSEGHDFTVIDSERFAAPLYRVANLLRGGGGVGWTTVSALSGLGYYYFEWLIWQRFGDAIRRKEFDIVHRLTPVSPTMPSTLAARCARAGTPFVLGPLNGGVRWPKNFDHARRKEREWLSYVRDAYKLLPGYRSTLAASAAIIAGSKSTLNDIPSRYRSKCVYLPENAIDPLRFPDASAPGTAGPLRACFVGRLVPYKGPDMLLEAVSDLARSGHLQLDVLGDGPMMPDLQRFVQANGLQESVRLHGWVTHTELHTRMRACQLLLFPSIREFGGGVVLEAMALGIVPVVVDYGGPGELVTDVVGFKIPLRARADLIDSLRRTVTDICAQPGQLAAKSAAARSLVRERYTWQAKARQVLAIYDWVLGHTKSRPEFFPALAPSGT